MDENVFNMSNGQSKHTNRRKPISMNITAANGGRIEVTGLYQLPVTVKDKTVELDVFIVRNLSSKFILGMDFMKLENININVPTEKISMDSKPVAAPVNNIFRRTPSQRSKSKWISETKKYTSRTRIIHKKG